VGNRDFGIIVGSILIICLYGCAGSTPYVQRDSVELKKIRNLAVIVNGDPEFCYIGEIRKESSTALIISSTLGGVVGGAVAQSVDTSNREAIDKKYADSIRPKDVETTCRTRFADKVMSALEESKQFDSIQLFDNDQDQQIAQKFDAVVNYRLMRLGARPKETGNQRIVLFIDFEISMKRTSDKGLIWNDRQTVILDERRTLEDYQLQNGLIVTDLNELINKAGARLAMLLVSL
jgi:hypothetical protein